MRNERCRNFALITYHPEEVIKSVLILKSTQIRHYSFIYHDKDTKVVDGELVPVTPHYHLLLNLNEAKTFTAVCKMFPDNQNTLAQPMRDMSACFDYLNHRDKPDKFQYDDSLITCDSLEWWQGLQKGDTDDRVMNIIDDIIAKVSFREMARRYGRDYVINRDKYYSFAVKVMMEEKVRVEEEQHKKDLKDIEWIQTEVSEIIDIETGEVKQV